jgi:hypothetical protein
MSAALETTPCAFYRRNFSLRLLYVPQDTTSHISREDEGERRLVACTTIARFIPFSAVEMNDVGHGEEKCLLMFTIRI